MREKEIQFESLPLNFTIEDDIWITTISKSDTRIKDASQLNFYSNVGDSFVPVKISEEADGYTFTFTVDTYFKTWEQVKSLEVSEKLRLLTNIEEVIKASSARVTFFLHPENIVFDENLMPKIVYRGIRNLIPPFEMESNILLKQYQCLAIAMFSKTFTYDQLYNGSMSKANTTEYERSIIKQETISDLALFLKNSHRKEQKKIEETMQLVPKRKFRLYYRLSMIMIAVSILLFIPLFYYGVIQIPFKDRLLNAHYESISNDYDGVIAAVKEDEPEKLSRSVQYVLAEAYIQAETLSADEREVIQKNLSLKSDENYLLYWIYNGRGDFEKTIDLAKYMDDPRLVMYGLIKKIEQDKNNPKLTGTEKEEAVSKSKSELDKLKEDYNLNEEDEDKEQETDEADAPAVNNQEAVESKDSEQPKDVNENQEDKPELPADGKDKDEQR